MKRELKLSCVDDDELGNIKIFEYPNGCEIVNTSRESSVFIDNPSSAILVIESLMRMVKSFRFEDDSADYGIRKILEELIDYQAYGSAPENYINVYPQYTEFLETK